MYIQYLERSCRLYECFEGAQGACVEGGRVGRLFHCCQRFDIKKFYTINTAIFHSAMNFFSSFYGFELKFIVVIIVVFRYDLVWVHSKG